MVPQNGLLLVEGREEEEGRRKEREGIGKTRRTKRERRMGRATRRGVG